MNFNEEDNHGMYAMQLVSSSILPMALNTAIQLGLLDVIAMAGPGAKLSSSNIASKLSIQNNPDAPLVLDRILGVLASYSVLTCSLSSSNERLYGLSPVSKYFLKNPDGASLAPFFQLIQDKSMVDTWYHLKDAVEEGGLLFKRVHGMNPIDYVKNDERLSGILKAGAKGYNPIFMKTLFESYTGFEGINTLVDVGGGDGSVLSMIISKYPNIKGINFDVAPVIEMAPSCPGIEHVAGDMFVNIPKGDAIFMKWILHGWDDEHCLQILKNCYEALPNNGKLMIVDVVIPEVPDTSLAHRSLFQFDLFLMNFNHSGKERTERELLSLAKESGFSGIRVAACHVYNFSLTEFYKN